jgi:hypothetical protein
MRIIMLTVIALTVLTSALWAADQAKDAHISDTFILSPEATSRTADDSARPAVFSNRRVPSLDDRETEPVCYQIRSYLMAKDDPESDTTSFVGYSTCRMSSRFATRHAGRSDKSEEPRESER